MSNSPSSRDASSAERWFRLAAPIEAVSYLVLVVFLIGRLAVDGPDLSAVLGPIHGTIVLAYLAVALRLRDEQGWPTPLFIRIVAATIVPGGGFVAPRWIEQHR